MVIQLSNHIYSCFFFFNDTATTEIYTLSLHDALPIWLSFTYITATPKSAPQILVEEIERTLPGKLGGGFVDRKSTRLNSSHQIISYAVFCLKKKKNNALVEM